MCIEISIKHAPIGWVVFFMSRAAWAHGGVEGGLALILIGVLALGAY